MKTSRKSVFSLILSLAVFFTACSRDSGDIDDPEEGNENEVIVTSNVSANTTWTKDKVWILAGRIAVMSGATLTIEPGTVIKARAGATTNAKALIVARGAKIMAEGTPTAPIIFTSVADEITPEQVASGNFVSPNMPATLNGLWGGVLILGNARISASAPSVSIEGIPATDPNGSYGGDNDTDNSGVLKYVSIRHGGTDIGAGNEINGLTLGGVGSGTVIENIEVVANFDDGIEWFGGTVNVKNVVVWNAGDDGIDTDQSWNGTLDNFAVITPGGHCFELDGPEGSANYGAHTIKNGMVNAQDAEDLINTDANTYVNLQNIFVKGFTASQVVRHNATAANVVTYSGINLQIPSGSIGDYVKNNGGTVVSPTPAGIVSGTTTTFDPAPLSWTWAAKESKL